MWWTVVYGVIIIASISLWRRISDKRKGLPPGPFCFPLIGCIVQVILQDILPFIAFQKLCKYYGNIYTVQLGVVKAVVINGYDAINEVSQSADWIGSRIDEKCFLDRSFGKPLGLITGRRDIRKETRRFCTKNLRDYGCGTRSTMESVIQTELEEFCSDVSFKLEKSDGILSGFPLFHIPVINIVWSFVAGERFHYEDSKLYQLFTHVDDFFKAGSFGAGPIAAYPFLCDWVPKLVGFDKMQKTGLAMQNYFKKHLADTRARGEYLVNPTNFIEIFLQKIDSREKNGTLEDVIYEDENLISILFDIFVAGSDTSSNALSFGLLYLILHPEIQNKVRSEIDEVVGRQRRPVYADKDRMPYTEATILEIYRMANVVPMTIRKLDMDASVGNWKLEKGMVVFLNFYSAAMDKDFWGDPDVFRPEHFLNSEGKVVNAEKIFTFSAGKRNCFGENLARSTIFVFLTGLLQQFIFSLNPAEPKPTTAPVLGFTLSPKPFSIGNNTKMLPFIGNRFIF